MILAVEIIFGFKFFGARSDQGYAVFENLTFTIGLDRGFKIPDKSFDAGNAGI